MHTERCISKSWRIVTTAITTRRSAQAFQITEGPPRSSQVHTLLQQGPTSTRDLPGPPRSTHSFNKDQHQQKDLPGPHIPTTNTSFNRRSSQTHPNDKDLLQQKDHPGPHIPSKRPHLTHRMSCRSRYINTELLQILQWFYINITLTIKR